MVLGQQGYGVIRVDSRRPAELRSLRDSWGQASRQAFNERRKLREEQEQRARYSNYPDRYRSRKARVQALYFDSRAVKPPPSPSPELLQRLFMLHASMFLASDSTGIPKLRPYAEVETTVVRMYPEWMADSLSTRDFNSAYAAEIGRAHV